MRIACSVAFVLVTLTVPFLLLAYHSIFGELLAGNARAYGYSEGLQEVLRDIGPWLAPLGAIPFCLALSETRAIRRVAGWMDKLTKDNAEEA